MTNYSSTLYNLAAKMARTVMNMSHALVRNNRHGPPYAQMCVFDTSVLIDDKIK